MSFACWKIFVGSPLSAGKSFPTLFSEHSNCSELTTLQKYPGLLPLAFAQTIPLPGISFLLLTFWWTPIYTSKPSTNITSSLKLVLAASGRASHGPGLAQLLSIPVTGIELQVYVSVFLSPLCASWKTHPLFIFVWAMPGTWKRRKEGVSRGKQTGRHSLTCVLKGSWVRHLQYWMSAVPWT